MVKAKTKVIRTRVGNNLYKFLQKFCRENETNISELNRAILEYFYIGTAMGELQKFPKSKYKKSTN